MHRPSQASLYNKLRRYDEAIKSYDRVIEINPNNVDAWNSKGLAFSNQGRYDEAIKSYDRVMG